MDKNQIATKKGTYDQPWFVYILKCSDKYLYTGISIDVKKRVIRHKNGKGAMFTRNKPPYELVYVKKYENAKEAGKVEREIKRYAKSKKEKLIAEFLHRLEDSPDSEIIAIIEVNSILQKV